MNKEDDPRSIKHLVSGKDIEDFCCDKMFQENYWCNVIHDDHMRFVKQGQICANCPLYLFKLHMGGGTINAGE